MARVPELEAKLGLPPETPDNSRLPPSKGHKPSPLSLLIGTTSVPSLSNS